MDTNVILIILHTTIFKYSFPSILSVSDKEEVMYYGLNIKVRGE